jgi:hypothetical protein
VNAAVLNHNYGRSLQQLVAAYTVGRNMGRRWLTCFEQRGVSALAANAHEPVALIGRSGPRSNGLGKHLLLTLATANAGSRYLLPVQSGAAPENPIVASCFDLATAGKTSTDSVTRWPIAPLRGHLGKELSAERGAGGAAPGGGWLTSRRLAVSACWAGSRALRARPPGSWG